ncbi:hypothetical protein BH18ACI4_BH18ACI4_27420 [soil metagenome]
MNSRASALISNAETSEPGVRVRGVNRPSARREGGSGIACYTLALMPIDRSC